MTTWTVPARVLRVVDADTLECDLDLGWHITYRAKIRLAGVNAPEMSTPEGRAARAFVDQLLANRHGAPVTVTSHSLDKYGRVLADVTWHENAGELSLAGEIVRAGHAMPYLTS